MTTAPCEVCGTVVKATVLETCAGCGRDGCPDCMERQGRVYTCKSCRGS